MGKVDASRGTKTKGVSSANVTTQTHVQWTLHSGSTDNFSGLITEA